MEVYKHASVNKFEEYCKTNSHKTVFSFGEHRQSAIAITTENEFYHVEEVLARMALERYLIKSPNKFDTRKIDIASDDSADKIILKCLDSYIYNITRLVDEAVRELKHAKILDDIDITVFIRELTELTKTYIRQQHEKYPVDKHAETKMLSASIDKLTEVLSTINISTLSKE